MAFRAKTRNAHLPLIARYKRSGELKSRLNQIELSVSVVFLCNLCGGKGRVSLLWEPPVNRRAHMQAMVKLKFMSSRNLSSKVRVQRAEVHLSKHDKFSRRKCF